MPAVLPAANLAAANLAAVVVAAVVNFLNDSNRALVVAVDARRSLRFPLLNWQVQIAAAEMKLFLQQRFLLTMVPEVC